MLQNIVIIYLIVGLSAAALYLYRAQSRDILERYSIRPSTDEELFYGALILTATWPIVVLIIVIKIINNDEY
jgi:hypothetical protein